MSRAGRSFGCGFDESTTSAVTAGAASVSASAAAAPAPAGAGVSSEGVRQVGDGTFCEGALERRARLCERRICRREYPICGHAEGVRALARWYRRGDAQYIIPAARDETGAAEVVGSVL